MITSEVVKAKVESLKAVISFIEEFKGYSEYEDMSIVKKYVEQQIESYRQLVKTLNNKNK